MDDVAFRFLATDQAPDFRSIARFRRRHLDALADLFLQSPHLAQKLGMVKMARVALDGRRRNLQRLGRAELHQHVRSVRAEHRRPPRQALVDAPRGRIPAGATLKQRMARKLRTKPGRKAYSRRKAIVEPVFRQIMTCQNGRQLLLRGVDGARGEWR